MQPNDDLKTVDKMIADLGGTDLSARSPGCCGLLLEHLRTALLGAMGSQYQVSLEQAAESIACIPSKLTRAGVKDSLRSLIDSESARLAAVTGR